MLKNRKKYTHTKKTQQNNDGDRWLELKMNVKIARILKQFLKIYSDRSVLENKLKRVEH